MRVYCTIVGKVAATPESPPNRQLLVVYYPTGWSRSLGGFSKVFVSLGRKTAYQEKWKATRSSFTAVFLN
jgi:hypothetical protein